MSIELYEGDNFWKSPSEYKPGEKVYNELVREIEGNLQVTLPTEYVELMKQQNGGNLTYGYIPFEDGDVVWIPYFQELDNVGGVGLSPVFTEECGLPEKLVLLTGDFETWLALDYRNTREPSVVYFQQSRTEDGEIVWEEYQIAASFGEFLTKIFKKV